MKKLMSFFISILFVLSLTGLCFAQAGAPAAPEKDNAATVEKSDVKAKKKTTKAKKTKKTKKAKKAKKSKKTKKAKKAAPESDQQ
jgi:hypothetical protein